MSRNLKVQDRVIIDNVRNRNHGREGVIMARVGPSLGTDKDIFTVAVRCEDGDWSEIPFTAGELKLDE